MVTCESTVIASGEKSTWATRPSVPTPVELIRTSPNRTTFAIGTALVCERASDRSTWPSRIHLWLMTRWLEFSAYFGLTPRAMVSVIENKERTLHPAGIGPNSDFTIGIAPWPGYLKSTNHSR